MLNNVEINKLNFKSISHLCEKIIEGITGKIYHAQYLVNMAKLIQPYVSDALILKNKVDLKHHAINLDDIISKFQQSIKCIIELIELDIETVIKKDPASKDHVEILLCYPGIKAIMLYRIAHILSKLDIPYLPRAISEYAHSLTGIDIHPEAVIGKQFFIDHGTGIVVGQTCIIGDNVAIYQGVTLGTKAFKRKKNADVITNYKRHPSIEDNVTIYANATILGNIKIGKNSIIGSNVTITEAIPANSKVTQFKYKQQLFSEGAGI
ncbi:hypothetical protein L3V82_02410 [Thiotrichales bacterium 19S3-7]|nr:hypothetical protein [Thiotrichales bacterium 19S3-7]MCF6801020.1 hypothetical protein [Thiotrichales bacterium 19S3-11]